MDDKWTLLSAETNSDLVLRTNKQDRLTITKDGKVGIGTKNDPDGQLTIESAWSNGTFASIRNTNKPSEPHDLRLGVEGDTAILSAGTGSGLHIRTDNGDCQDFRVKAGFITPT